MCPSMWLVKLMTVTLLSERLIGARGSRTDYSDTNFKSPGIFGENVQTPEDVLERFLTKPNRIVAVELSDPLLKTVNVLFQNQNLTALSNAQTTLATFDSTGLQDKTTYSETSEFLKGISGLKASPNQREAHLPTLHTVNNLIQNNPIGCFTLLITKTPPSDQDFRNILAESLSRKNCQLSVLWYGDGDGGSHELLKELVDESRGNFGLPKNDRRMLVEAEEGHSESGTSIFKKIRFPVEENSVDDKMNIMSRVGSERASVNSFFPLTVEVASGGSLEVHPGTPTEIKFNVKNNLNVPVNVAFGAKFNSVAQFIRPQRVNLQPSSSVTVTVIVSPFPNAPVNAKSTVTFTAFLGNKIISRSAFVSSVPQATYDKTEPKIYYKFEGDCSDFAQPQTCERGYWGLEINVRDEESGLLKVISEPYGLLFQPDFVAGTKNQVTAYYSASCCQTKVDIWAEDLRGNYIKKSYDVFNQTLLAGEIAAIVIGVLLLLFILIVMIIAVIMFRRRNQRNLIIPRARAESR